MHHASYSVHDCNTSSIVPIEYEQLQSFRKVFLHYASIRAGVCVEMNLSFINEELRLT